MDTLEPGSPDYNEIRNVLLNPTVETLENQMRILLGTGDKISAFLASPRDGEDGPTMADLMATKEPANLQIVLAHLICIKYGKIGPRHPSIERSKHETWTDKGQEP